jgi:hypothetical protein
MREIAGVQNPVVKHARATGWLAWKLKIEGQNGCPDFWFFKDGILVIIEFKAHGKPRKRQQELRAAELEKRGFKVYVIDNADKGRALLDHLAAL